MYIQYIERQIEKELISQRETNRKNDSSDREHGENATQQIANIQTEREYESNSFGEN